MYGIIFPEKKISEDPTRYRLYCLLCIERGKNPAPLMPPKGAGTGGLDRHLKKHGISKESHESGAARGGPPQQTQICVL